jgi:hypothetical protein
VSFRDSDRGHDGTLAQTTSQLERCPSVVLQVSAGLSERSASAVPVGGLTKDLSLDGGGQRYGDAC